MKHRRFVVSALAVILFALPASAQTWTGPDLSRRPFTFGHAVENFDIAISEVCFPYLLQNAAANTWTRSRRAGIVWFPPGGPFVGLTTYLVGGSAGAIVGVGNRGGYRECTVKADSVSADRYLAALDDRLATLPFRITPSAYAFPPNSYAVRRLLCSAPDGPQIAVAISAGSSSGERGQTLVTFLEMTPRDERCDLTTAPPQAPPAN